MAIDLKALYEIIKSTAEHARRSLKIPNHPDQNASYLHLYSGFPAYVGQYNRFSNALTKLFGTEAEELFPLLPESMMHIGNWAPVQFRGNLELVSVGLDQMVTYLQSKLNIVDQEIEAILDFIEANLRPAFREDPQDEDAVQDALEIMFRAGGYDFLREREVVPYSVKSSIPDFTFDTLNLALEVKLCNKSKEKKKLLKR